MCFCNVIVLSSIMTSKYIVHYPIKVSLLSAKKVLLIDFHLQHSVLRWFLTLKIYNNMPTPIFRSGWINNNNNNEVVYFRSRTGWNYNFSIIHTFKDTFFTISWVHIVVGHFMEPFWICGCQIASEERALLSDTHPRIWKSAKLADYQILPESLIFWT